MQHDKIKAAIMEATRFISKATEFLKAEEITSKSEWGGCNPKQSGAARRASLDLTRALADMRRP